MRTLALVACVALTGCSLVNDPSMHRGGMPDAGVDAGPPPIPASSFCREAAQLLCYSRFNCCSTAPHPPTAQQMTDCVTMAQQSCAMSFLSQLLADDSTGYDPVIAREVIQEGFALADACNATAIHWYTSPEGLQRVFQGTIAGGSSCTPRSLSLTNFDYAAIVRCQDPRACIASDATHWFCTDRQPMGGPCVLYLDCQEGMYCPWTMLSVPPGTCTPQIANNSPCSNSVDCQSLVCDSGTMMCRAATQDDVFCNINPYPMGGG